MTLENHPTVRRIAQRAQEGQPEERTKPVLDRSWLRQLALDRGADDAGMVELARPGLDHQREEILRNYPWTKSLLSFVVRMAREPVRGAPRSVANLEFHRAGHAVDETSAAIVAALEVRELVASREGRAVYYGYIPISRDPEHGNRTSSHCSPAGPEDAGIRAPGTNRRGTGSLVVAPACYGLWRG